MKGNAKVIAELNVALREELTAMGLEVMDTPEGTRVRPRA